MTTWIAAARAAHPPARRHEAARIPALPCICDEGDTLPPREHDAMRFCADPTIRLTLACAGTDRNASLWHPWE